MPVNYVDPYSGEQGETCSVSFAAQNQMAGSTSSPQTEAQYNTSKLLGEWGVLMGKLDKGEIPDGTKVLSYENIYGSTKGYLMVKNGKLVRVYYISNKRQEKPADPDLGEAYIKSEMFSVAIPQAAAPKAAPAPVTPVNAGSASVGSMSHEDVSALFVKIKDDLAKEQGLNVKGANPALDAEVYKAIAKLTGYTPEEIKGKIDAYKAAGNKLSALKKKVMAGTYKIPQTPAQVANPKPQPTKATPAAPLNVSKKTSTPAPDPKPNGVPTVATPALAEQAKQEVKEAVAAKPEKMYSDEDVAAAYIIAKDAIVAASNGKWTLYTKSDELDLEIAIAVGLKTGLNPTQQKIAIANYLGSGKKLSVLKKQLIKQGAMKAQAETLKKKNPSGAAAQVNEMADAGYTPTPAPSAGTPPIETGKPAPKRVEKEAQQSGDISGIPDTVKKLYFDRFKGTGAKSWLSSGPSQNYEGFANVLAEMQLLGHSKNLTMLQLIRVVDEEGAKKAGVENGKLFEKQVATWLTTPEGTKYVKDVAEKLAKQQAEAKALQDLIANQPPLPKDSAQFKEWSLDKARTVSRTWLEAEPWTDEQSVSLTVYTSNAYSDMNSYLRGLQSSISRNLKEAIKGAKAGMRPTTEPILVKRGSGASQFSGLGIKNGEGQKIFGLTGKTFEDGGFLSTSAGGSAAFGGEVLLEIECPVGTPMAYVAPISRYPHENEMLLQAGMKYKILNVRKEDSQYVVRMRVVDWPGKAQ